MSDLNPACAVSLYLKGHDLNPEELTLRFGIEPTRAHKRGKTWFTSAGTQVVEKTGLWVLSIRNFGELSAGLAQLVAMTDRGGSPSEIPGIQEAFFDIFIAVDADDEGGGTGEFEMDAAYTVAIGKLALPIRVTVAVVRP